MKRGSLVAMAAVLALAAVPAATVGAATSPTYDRDPVFSPRGRALAFIRLSDRTAPGRVMVIRRDGRGLRAVTPPEQYPYGITWSPDGRSLAYTSGGDVWRVDLAGGEPVNLTSDPTHDDWQAAWSPDGQWIAFDRFEKCYRCTGLHLVSADGTQSRDIAVEGDQARHPMWSPDGTRIALSQSTPVVVGLDGATLATVPRGAAYVTWSPDGTHVLYTSGGVRSLDLATGLESLVTKRINAYPRWSRDGGEVAGSSRAHGELVLVRGDGSPVATIAAAELRHDAPSWGAQDRVAFVHAGWCGIDIAWGDGTHVRRLTRVC